MARPKFRKGDVVSLAGTVQSTTFVDDNAILVRIDGYYTDTLHRSESLTLVRQMFEPGDEIEWEVHTERNARGIVRAAHAKYLGVESPDETMDTVYPHNKPTLVRTAAEIEANEREKADEEAAARRPPVAPATPPRNDPPATTAAAPADDIQF